MRSSTDALTSKHFKFIQKYIFKVINILRMHFNCNCSITFICSNNFQFSFISIKMRNPKPSRHWLQTAWTQNTQFINITNDEMKIKVEIAHNNNYISSHQCTEKMKWMLNYRFFKCIHISNFQDFIPISQ